MTLAGARFVVVGGTSGMGLATARAAAAQGADVVAAGRRPVDERAPIKGVRHAQVDVDNPGIVVRDARVRVTDRRRALAREEHVARGILRVEREPPRDHLGRLSCPQVERAAVCVQEFRDRGRIGERRRPERELSHHL